MNPRFLVDLKLAATLELDLPAAAARHAQVLRLQAGDALTLFDGRGWDWPSVVMAMGRNAVRVRVGEPVLVANELAVPVTLAVGMPANERMDWLVEKATELGAAAIQPLVCERSVLRVQAQRAERKRAHWQAVAASAAEQCGRAVVPTLGEVMPLARWLATVDAAPPSRRFVLSLGDGTLSLAAALDGRTSSSAPRPVAFLSGPEGGLSEAEDAAARAAGFVPLTLGPRVLRAETAPLAALAALAALLP